jgi:hypothetical protein
MKRRLIAVLSVFSCGAMVALPASAGAQVPGSTTLTFFEPDAGGTFKLVDTAPKSPTANPESRRFRFSVGDQVLFSNQLFDRQGGTRQGTLYGVATVIKGKTFASISVMAQVVYVLTDGSQLVANGVFSFAQPTAQAAITGGSGRYAGARGSVVSKSSASSSTDTLTLLP